MATFSMNIIAQTLSQHSEMIAPGVMGINFMKPEKPINTLSEVYKLVQEEEQNKVKSPTPGSCPTPPLWKPTKIPPTVSPKPKAPMTNAVSPAPAPAPAPKPVHSPTPKPAPRPAQIDGPSQGPCNDCGRMINGPFVSLSDRILHDECFNCSTCGSSLKNIGFHNINNKLYCDTHAKLAARVIASSVASGASTFAPSPAPQPLPTSIKPVQAPVAAPPAPQAPSMMSSAIPASVYQSVPTPYGQNLTNLPQSPSSSGNLAFRSISPTPYKRISGEYHRVNAPSSPTPGSGPSGPLAYSSGPLPFEMKPYMPPDQGMSALFSGKIESSSQSTEISQTSSQVTQMTQVQRTTQITQSSSQSQMQSQSQQCQYALDYKQVIGGQSKTKFVWPPQRCEADGSTTAAPAPAPSQNYSPLATQSTPVSSTPAQKGDNAPAFRSVQPPFPSSQPKQETSAPAESLASIFSVPPLPSTFSAQPASVDDGPKEPAKLEPAKEEPAPEPAPAPAPAPALVSAPVSVPPLPKSGSFAPVLPPIVDLKPTAAPLQPGVPTGAGSKPAPKKGRGQLMKETVPGRIPICGDCGEPIRGPFIIALNRTWCPDHFHCNNLHCKTPLIDVGFVEEQGQLYCENCYEAYLAPICNKCNVRIKGDCLNALDKQWHPDCFICGYCHKPFGNNSFYLEDGLPYCEKDWNELFTTKCVGCGFPIEAGDRWVEALNNNYHSQCFKCSICQKNLEGQSFYAKGGKPFCKQHAR